MVPQRLELIDRAEVDRLCSDAVAENQTLDFKRELPRKDAKSDLLKDVCAFANADGGDLVYGIADAAGIAKAVSPITGETPDHAMRRLGQVLDAIEPRVRGMQMQPVDMGEGGYCLILRVPASFDAPHRYYSEGGSRSDVFCRFVVRNGTRTMDLTYEQLRTAFDRTATLTDRAARFIEERMDVIRARKTWRALESGPVCVVHVVPIASQSGRSKVDVVATYNNFGQLVFESWHGGSRELNLDGLFVHPGGPQHESDVAYVQVFRGGALEAARVAKALSREVKHIPSTVVTTFYRAAIIKLLAFARSVGISGPAIVRATLLETTGYAFAIGGEHWERNTAFADRPDLPLPDEWVDSIEDVTNADSIVRPMMDVLWQAFGVERCMEYDLKGVWNPRR